MALIRAAKACGADAVKLQTYQPERMVGNEAIKIEGGPWAGRKMIELYREAVTPLAWHKRLFKEGREQGIEVFSSAFSIEDVDSLEELDCPRYKIASFELLDLSLIKYAAQTQKPVILSTGMATLPEIEEGVDAALDGGCEDLTILRCSSSYPAPLSTVNLNTIKDMQDYFTDYAACAKVKIGFSDHTQGFGAAVAAVTLGAVMIEKHLKLKPEDGGPDAAFSADPTTFAAMVNAGRQAVESLGAARYGPTPEERSSLALRRSLWWAEPGEAGEVMHLRAFRTARPALGLAPRELDRLIGKRLARNVCVGEPVREEDFA